MLEYSQSELDGYQDYGYTPEQEEEIDSETLSLMEAEPMGEILTLAEWEEMEALQSWLLEDERAKEAARQAWLNRVQRKAA